MPNMTKAEEMNLINWIIEHDLDFYVMVEELGFTETIISIHEFLAKRKTA